MCLRIPLRRATVKELHRRLHHASQREEVRLVRRITVLLDLLGHHVPGVVLRERWSRSIACLSQWRQAFLLRGVDRLVYHHSGGRRPKWTPRQKKRLVELLEAGPQVVGCETACGTAGRIQGLIWRACGVLDNCQYVCTLRRNFGFSCHKARCVSDPLDAARRHAWLQEEGPMILRAAQRWKGLRLLEEEASFAQWGSFSDTWARRGQPPAVQTSGTRQGYKVFGAMEYFAGRWCSQGIEGRLASDSSQAFLRTILAHPTAHLCLIHERARYHTSQATTPFWAQHAARLTVHPLPSYSPAYHPIEDLWQKTKKGATHHQYFKELARLTVSVEKALAYFAAHPETV